MLQKIILSSLIVLALAITPSAFAGKVELTTYYPAPYGEYAQLQASDSFIPPRMTTIQRDAISTTTNPPLTQGMVIFNTTTNRLEVYNGTAWGSGGGVSCSEVTAHVNFNGDGTASVVCPAGKIVTGGGCSGIGGGVGMQNSYPNNNGWTCAAQSSAGVTTHAICC